MAVESVREAISRLNSEGYTVNLRAKKGCLEDVDSAARFKPEDFAVDSVFRFEGNTDIDDESAIFALNHKSSSVKGLYVVTYGPMMDTEDLIVVEKLGNP